MNKLTKILHPSIFPAFRYPAELHMVHYNTKYGGFTEATAFQDGLAVLGVMIEVPVSHILLDSHS